MLDRLAPYVLSILRIMAGLLVLQYGLAKLFGWPAVKMFENLPWLSLFGIAGMFELVGGVLLILGLFTRAVAFVLSGEMAFAYFIEHFPRGFFPILNHGDLAVRCACQHKPPRISDQRSPTRPVPRGMGPDLVCGEHEALVLDRAGSQQHLPVIATGVHHECRRDHQHGGRLDRRQLPVELRKPKVVADREAEPYAIDIQRNHVGAAGGAVVVAAPGPCRAKPTTGRSTAPHLPV